MVFSEDDHGSVYSSASSLGVNVRGCWSCSSYCVCTFLSDLCVCVCIFLDFSLIDLEQVTVSPRVT